jgi:apolipoprotein N-acyltransferase
VTPARAAVLAAPFASGLLLWSAAPPVGFGWAAWFALVPAAAVALAAPGTRWGRAAVPLAVAVFLELLLVPALPFGLADDQWGDPVLPILVGGSPVLAVALVAVPLVALALYAVRFPLPYTPRGPWSAVAVAGAVGVPAVVWTAFDLLRTKFDPAGFWGPLFLTQHDTVARRLAVLAGPWLVTFALVAVNYAAALAFVGTPRRRLAAVPAAIALAVAAAVLGVGEAAPRGATTAVAAVQPGYDTAEFERPVLRHLRRETRDLERASLDLVEDLAPLTREAGGRGARIVVWPEATIWVDPHENVRVRAALTRLAAETDAVLVVPYFLRDEARGAVVAVLPDGTLTPPQPKQRPMWFLGERGGDPVPPEPVETDVARLGTLLGVDAQDPAGPRRLVAEGADLVASSTHDWGALAEQQRALARFHATAVRAPFVRADWRYGSTILDARGRIEADAGLAKRRTVLVAEVEVGAATTPYGRVGDAFGWACVVALAPLLLAVSLLRSGSERADADRSADAAHEPELPAHPPA